MHADQFACYRLSVDCGCHDWHCGFDTSSAIEMVPKEVWTAAWLWTKTHVRINLSTAMKANFAVSDGSGMTYTNVTSTDEPNPEYVQTTVEFKGAAYPMTAGM